MTAKEFIENLLDKLKTFDIYERGYHVWNGNNDKVTLDDIDDIIMPETYDDLRNTDVTIKWRDELDRYYNDIIEIHINNYEINLVLDNIIEGEFIISLFEIGLIPIAMRYWETSLTQCAPRRPLSVSGLIDHLMCYGSAETLNTFINLDFVKLYDEYEKNYPGYHTTNFMEACHSRPSHYDLEYYIKGECDENNLIEKKAVLMKYIHTHFDHVSEEIIL